MRIRLSFFVPAMLLLDMPHRQAPEVALPNDNRVAAGRLTGNVLTIDLEAQEATWRPEADDGASIPVYAFREAGRPVTLPGPMIRVPLGTEIVATVRNRLARPVRIVGLAARESPAPPDSAIQPGAQRLFRFKADVPGTYFYFGRTEDLPQPTLPGNGREASLVGAFIVDSVGALPPTRERVLVIHGFFDTVSSLGKRSDASHEVLNNEFIDAAYWPVIGVNGKSWPFTERLSYTEGDTIRFRVINAGPFPHPMHLHGFHFQVDARGSVRRDTVYSDSTRREVVTELLTRGTTMSMRWRADRPGNWLFHCHLITHIASELRLTPSPNSANHANHAESGMAGLVVGLHVAPRRASVAPRNGPATRRRMRLFVTEKPGVYGGRPGLSYVLQEGARAPSGDSLRLPSSTLYLHQGEPTEIMIVNRAKQATSIHWHGLELESFFDGVGDWSGWGDRVARPIAPGDSFIVRLTPPRAGTFIYHTHLAEGVQLASGLFGALIVLPPGAIADSTERILLVGLGGPNDDASVTVNGSATPGPIELRAGVAHRFRIINISPAEQRSFELLAGATAVSWRPVAKDGANLPALAAREEVARKAVNAGETYDFEVLRQRPESLTMQISGTASVAARLAFFAQASSRERAPRFVLTIPVIVR